MKQSTRTRFIYPILIILVLFASLLVRLYQWQRPVGDWHSWRQVDTVSVTREYVKHGIDLLHPRYHDLSDIPSGQDNLEGYRMVEFPFMNGLIAQTYQLTDGFGYNIAVFSRIWSIGMSLLSIYVLYLLVSELTNRRIGIFSATVYSLLPFNIFFHTTVLPEVSLVLFSLLATYAWVRFCKTNQSLWLVLAGVTAGFALLLKPIFVFYGLAWIYIFVKEKSVSGFKDWRVYLVGILAILPLICWRQWILQFPEGIPASSWLFNGNDIRFKGAFFRWLFADRFGRLILGYWGLLPLGIGLLLRPVKNAGWFFHWWFLGMLIYLTVFATGNVTHDYYQIFIVPIISIFVGLGLEYLFFGVTHLKIKEIISTHTSVGLSVFGINKQTAIEDDIEITKSPFHPLVSIMLGLVATGFMFGFGWYEIRGNFNINNPAIVEAGQAVDRLTPPEALVIAPYGGDTAFLYQTNRTGWPIGFSIQEKIDMGASYYVSTSYDDEARALEEACELVEKTDTYILIKLSNCQLDDMN